MPMTNTGSDPNRRSDSVQTESRLLRLWGKTDKAHPDQAHVFHPAIYHMLDVGHVAEILLELPRWRSVLTEALGTTPAIAKRVVPYLVGAHDLAKVSVPFQAMVPAQRARLEAEGFAFGRYSDWPDASKELWHGVLGYYFARRMLKNELPEHLLTALTAMIGGHHGLYQRAERGFGGKYSLLQEPAEWDQLRRCVLKVLHDDFLGQESFKWPDPPNVSVAIAALNGLTIVSDWLGSDESFFHRGSGKVFGEYVAWSRQWARKRVEDAGFLAPVTSKAPTAFRGLFPKIITPHPVQLVADKIPSDLLAAPSITVVEQQTGGGKTELALAIAHRIATLRGTDEFYIALPSMATSNAMYERIQEHLDQRLKLPAEMVRLVHGQDWLARDEINVELLSNGSGDATPSRDLLAWFQPKKVALIAPFGVGTVDQAMMAALHVRFGALRMIGLARKVVVLDEIHAYDTYMDTILKRLLTWLGELGTSVILLSATLPLTKRRMLLEAFMGRSLPELAGWQAYPALITAAKGKTPAFRWTLDPEEREVLCKSHKSKTLLQRLHYDDTPDGTKLKADWLIEQVKAGGCVCWIANTVQRAQDVFRQLKEIVKAEYLDIDLDLLHSQIPPGERKEREERVKAKYGKGHTGQPRHSGIVVATQVIEQSIDVDFDVMASDLCPVDLLLQRDGRLHRHDRVRPEKHREPVLHINYLTDEEGKLVLGDADEGIYGAYLSSRTLEVLEQNAWGPICIPDSYRPLVEQVYHEGKPPADSKLLSEWQELDECRGLLEGHADKRIVLPPNPEEPFCYKQITFNDDEEGTTWLDGRTRWGRESITVIPLFRDGDQARLTSASEPLNIQRAASKEDQRHMMKRQLRISRHYAVEAIKAVSKIPDWRPPLFTGSPGLDGVHPLWLRQDGTQWLEVENRKVKFELTSDLGLVIEVHKK
jgi:CRISPR-associated endonuclease/helicase Cas3